MRRNITPLFNLEALASDDEIRAASLQFKCKVSGIQKSSQANQPVFNTAIDDVLPSRLRRVGSPVALGRGSSTSVGMTKDSE